MKADILRRAEAMSNDEDEDVGTSAAKVDIDVAYDDELELDGLSGVIVGGEGDESGQEDDEEEGGGPTPEMVLELAYIRDPKLFERDAQTRRGQSRMDLKTQTGESNDCWLFIGLLWEFSHHTGWSDEQIEGWKIMLERNVSLYTLDF
jgi:activating signal cointegrator complex subunit 2